MSDSVTNRREFIRQTGVASVGAVVAGALAGCTGPARPGRAVKRTPFAVPPMERVRVGFVGVGGMGSVHVRNLLKIEGVEIRAVCDIVPEKVTRVQGWVEEAGQPQPARYDRGETDYERMCEAEDLDLVFTATPWRWHVPVCVAAMRNGKHAATEVPAAYTIDGCWELVETAEATRKHCVMMENCCYGRSEMIVLNLVRRGLLGDVLHAEGGYLHDLRAIKFSRDGEGLWRRAHSETRNGNLYPTHGLGPVAQCMNINRGDQFDFVVSMSGPSRGLPDYARTHLDATDSRRSERYVLGDVNTTLIQTAMGKTITVVHDTNLPRPYSRINLVQGTRGVVQGYPDRVHIEGRSPGHGWEELSAYAEEFEHPLWRKFGAAHQDLGHGSMDFIESYRLIHCLRNGLPMDMDVYDAAAWSVICELSERSVANRSRPVDVPDFTRGAWKTTSPLGIVDA